MDLPMDRSLPYPFTPGDPDTDGQEPRARDSLFLMARLRTPSIGETFSVRIRNLSPGGLMADFAVPLPRDTQLEVEVRGIGWVPGKVAWFAEGRTGIAFDAPIDPRKARKPVAGAATAGILTAPVPVPPTPRPRRR
ncbi:PilZ domain-containing protein [Sphingomonas bacterium]|uniref:PilZ domain-containing protein n=1 Tax=Sphingomonas bacterium TaxID=1895847 RepID=UPI0020C732E1|nr:PilZ domain-containing protein [Sphingomonas bacterium]